MKVEELKVIFSQKEKDDHSSRHQIIGVCENDLIPTGRSSNKHSHPKKPTLDRALLDTPAYPSG
jgi:hypothetical protein